MKPKFLRPHIIDTANLIGYWKLWAGLTSTAIVFDYSLNGNLGTVSGTDIAPLFPGFSFNGTDDIIDVGAMGTMGSLMATNKPTFSIWVRCAVTTSGQSPIGGYNAGANTAIAIVLNKNSAGSDEVGSIGLYMRDEDGNELHAAVNGDTGITDGAWHHLAVHFDGPNNLCIVYLDGAAQTVTHRLTNTPDNFANFARNVYIGASAAGTPSSLLAGSIDDVRIYNSIKTAIQVRNIYESTKWRYQT